jgi:anthranilate phosphoribosyltransferase
MGQLTYYLHKLFDKQKLTKAEAQSAMQVMLYETNSEQTAAFLSLLKYRGETSQEVAGMLQALERDMVALKCPYPILDIVGTGGDLANTVNISTGSAILSAACGIPVVKHGNRAVSSVCGSADVLEALGIHIMMPLDQVTVCLRELNIGFLFAPLFYPALKKLRQIRTEMAVPTIFNILGPLLNPAKVQHVLLGVANESMLELMSDVVMQMQCVDSALIFHGSGLDEMTTLGKISAYKVMQGIKQKIEIDPLDLGFKPCKLADIQGGNVTKNAGLLVDALCGNNEAIADALILNAGAALMVYGKTSSLEAGVAVAKKIIEQGKALELLDKWIAFSKKTQRGQSYE